MLNPRRALSKAFFFLLFVCIIPSFSVAKEVSVVKIEGVINPVVAEFLTKSIKKASSNGSECIIIQLDTPGGLDLSMRLIVKEIMNASLPVVVYVSPSGARAASAGVMITLASHIAAMAPGTNIGAAHPVAMGGKKMDETMEKKVLNDAAAYIESIANKRGRNAEWAVKAVKESASITEKQALKLGVIDLIAADLESLLKKIDGKEVEIDSVTKKLAIKNAHINYNEMGLRDRILNTVSNPNIAYILMMIGLVGLYFELAHPGVIFPGVIGGICLILAFYALQTLPVNYAGLLLILLAVIFFIAEIKVTSFGLLTIGGIASLFFGSIMLFDSSVPYLRVSLEVIIPTVIAISGSFILIIVLAIKTFLKKTETGIEGLIGKVGTVTLRIAPEGKIFVHGEYWNAYSEEVIEKEEKARIVDIKELTAKVEKVEAKMW